MSSRTKDYRRQYDREYKTFRRREAGVPVRRLRNPTSNYGEGRTLLSPKAYKLDGKLVFTYIDKYLTYSSSRNRWSSKQIEINGVKVTTADQRYILRLKSGETKRTSLERASELCVKYGLDYIELVEFAKV